MRRILAEGHARTRLARSREIRPVARQSTRARDRSFRADDRPDPADGDTRDVLRPRLPAAHPADRRRRARRPRDRRWTPPTATTSRPTSPARPSRRAPASSIFPDVRGLHAYYQDLALRFAENGIDADRHRLLRPDGAASATAGPGFPSRSTCRGCRSTACAPTANAAIDHIRAETGVERLFTSASAWADASRSSARRSARASPASSASTAGRSARTAPTPRRRPTLRRASSARCSPCSGVRTRGSRRSAVTTFEAALGGAGVPHEVTTYPKAPHGFFDKKADEFSVTSAKAWDQVARLHPRRGGGLRWAS